MKKQKICIIGGSLTGLVTAISLSKLNCEIDLITGNVNKNLKSNKTIAISQNNYEFLKKLNIFKFNKKKLWPCSKMKLYTEIKDEKFSEIFQLNNDNKKQQQILYMLENSKIIKYMMKKIKQTKSISLISHKMISRIVTSGFLKSLEYKNNSPKYNLMIVCAGSNSSLVKDLFKDQFIEHSYDQTSITAILNHKSIKNDTARQVFLDYGILALLPISNTKTSIVWSVEKKMYKKNDLLIKKKIKFYTKNYLKKVKFITNIEYKDLNFLIRKKYYKDRILLFGDALRVVHPLAGQGFNMMLRDLSCLRKILNNKINLGLDIGSLDILSEFSSEIKPRNFIYSMGINYLKNFFSSNNRYLKQFRNDTLSILNKSSLAKNTFINIADKGLKF